MRYTEQEIVDLIMTIDKAERTVSPAIRGDALQSIIQAKEPFQGMVQEEQRLILETAKTIYQEHKGTIQGVTTDEWIEYRNRAQDHIRKERSEGREFHKESWVMSPGVYENSLNKLRQEAETIVEEDSLPNWNEFGPKSPTKEWEDPENPNLDKLQDAWGHEPDDIL